MDFKGLTEEQKLSKVSSIYTAVDQNMRQNKITKRIIDNTNMYSGINNKQWPNGLVEELASAGMQATTINYTQKEVKRKTGLLLDNPVKTKFFARGDRYSNQTNIMQDLFDYNYNRGQWDRQIKSQVRDGNIMVGFSKMFWDFSHDREFGDIGLKRINPKFVKWSQEWTSDDFRDCEYVTEEYWYTPSEMASYFNVEKKAIKDAIASQKQLDEMSSGVTLTNRLDDEIINPFENKINGKYKVVEFHYLEAETIEYVIDSETNDKMVVSDLTEEQLLKMYQPNGSRYYRDSETILINKVFIYCPNILDGYVLYDGRYSIQLGRLPYFLYAYDIQSGEVQGVVDQIAGLNKTINKRESAITHIISTTSNNNYTAEQDAFVDSNAKRDFKKNLSKGGQVFDVARDANARGAIKLLDKAPVPTDLLRTTERTVAQLGDIANTNESISGKGAGSHESSTAFNVKRKATLIADALMEDNYKKLIQDIAEAFYYAFPQVYSGPEREFFLPDGREVVINQFGINASGEIQVDNDVSNLPRYGFIIDMSKMGATKREENLATYIELKKVTTNPLYKNVIDRKIIEYMDLDTAEKEDFIKASDIFMEFEMTQMQYQTAQMKQGLQQLEASAQQAQQPQGGFQGFNAPPDARAISKGAGMGEIPSGAGIAGQQSSANNVGSAPSDMTNR